MKKEGEGRAGKGRGKEGRRLGYKAKNSEQGRRMKGWKREMERMKKTGL